MVRRRVVTRCFDKQMIEVFGSGETAGYEFCMDPGSSAETDFCLMLAEVMIRALLVANPVLFSSKHLTTVFRELIFRGANEKIAKDILGFYNGGPLETGVLDLDGFISFMLRGYSERINAVLYRVVRDGLRKGETV